MDKILPFFVALDKWPSKVFPGRPDLILTGNPIYFNESRNALILRTASFMSFISVA